MECTKLFRLNFSDLMYLHKERIGMRYTSLDGAREEQKSGGTGDLAPLTYFVAPNSTIWGDVITNFADSNLFISEGWSVEEKARENTEVLSMLHLFDNETMMRSLPQHIQDDCIRRMEEVIKAHILSGLKLFIYQHGGYTFNLALLLMTNRDTTAPYDYGNYALGKIGKRRFEADAVLDLVHVEPPLTISAKPDEKEVRQYIDTLVEKLFAGLCRSIKQRAQLAPYNQPYDAHLPAMTSAAMSKTPAANAAASEKKDALHTGFNSAELKETKIKVSYAKLSAKKSDEDVSKSHPAFFKWASENPTLTSTQFLATIALLQKNYLLAAKILIVGTLTSTYNYAKKCFSAESRPAKSTSPKKHL